MERLRALVYGTVLLVLLGWLLHVGKGVLVPAVLGAVIVYVIVGLAQALERVPGVGPHLPRRLRYVFSILLIGFGFFMLAYLIMANMERAMALAPQYQASLLAAISASRCSSGSRPSRRGPRCATTCSRGSTCSGCSARRCCRPRPS